MNQMFSCSVCRWDRCKSHLTDNADTGFKSPCSDKSREGSCFDCNGYVVKHLFSVIKVSWVELETVFFTETTTGLSTVPTSMHISSEGSIAILGKNMNVELAVSKNSLKAGFS